MSTTPKPSRFSNILAAVLLYTLIVILWGAWVRISHSGDGCGDTWPLCRGQIIPEAQQGKTWVELSHRLMSGIFGFLILGLYLKVRKSFAKNHPIRLWALLSLIFTISEALLGAKLVLFKLVSSNDSPYRAFIMALHLINSMMLTASIAMTWEFSKSSNWQKKTKSPLSLKKLSLRQLSGAFVIVFFAIATTGSIAALANTLFPATSLLQGFNDDWNPNSHFLIRLRGLHPLAGIFIGGLLTLSTYLSVQMLPTKETILRKRGTYLFSILTVAILFGMLTLFSLAPVWMKLGHLLIAHSVWICLCLWLNALRWKQVSFTA